MKTDYQSFVYTTIGVSHAKEGKACQDCSANYSDGKRVIVAISDGHGESNCFRSDRGARFAADCAIDNIRAFVDRYRGPANKALDAKATLEKAIGALVRSVASSWQAKVEEHYAETPFTAEELAQCDEKRRKRFEAGKEPFKAYGATLIAAAIAENYWFGFQIGDGRFTALNADGSFSQPVPWDEKCFLNITTSICDYDANDRPRVYCELNAEKEPPIALFLCSDGIDDNYPADEKENAKYLYRLYAQIAIAFAEEGFDATRKQLGDLCDSFAKKGKGDDTSLAIVVDTARIKAIAPAMKALAEKPIEPPQPAVGDEKPAPSDKQEIIALKSGATPNSSPDYDLLEKQLKTSKAYNIYNALRNMSIFLLIVVVALAAFIVFEWRSGDANKDRLSAAPPEHNLSASEESDDKSQTENENQIAADDHNETLLDYRREAQGAEANENLSPQNPSKSPNDNQNQTIQNRMDI